MYAVQMTFVVMDVHRQTVLVTFLAILSEKYMVAIQRLKIAIHSANEAMILVFLNNAFHSLTPQRFHPRDHFRRFRLDSESFCFAYNAINKDSHFPRIKFTTAFIDLVMLE